MDLENHKDDKCLNKVLARNASLGCSSRVYYYRSGEGVPFKWEMQPGIAKHPPKEELLPPLSLPPAILSLGLPKPPIFQEPKPSSSTWSRLLFWKRNSSETPILQRQSRTHRVKEEGSQECWRDQSVNCGLDVFAGLECSSDSEFVTMASPFDSSFSSSSSSSSSSLSFMKSRPSLISASSESPTRGIYGKPLSCFPMHITKILVSIAR